MENFDVAIIGNGFCSLVTAAHLARASRPLRIAVIGRETSWGPGLAYGACHAHHLLNVPARKMSAFADDPGGFVRWVQDNCDADSLKEFSNTARPLEESFLPRAVYGRYLQNLASETRSLAQKNGHRLDYKTAAVTDLDFDSKGCVVSFKAGTLHSAHVVLATGVLPALQSDDDPAGFMADPWTMDFSVFKNSQKPVVILGLGLTMIDVVSSLARRNFKGDIIALSRRGLMPCLHAEREDAGSVRAIAEEFLPVEGSLAEKMRRLRANAAYCQRRNVPWQWYMDYIRPRIPELWSELSCAEQKRFLGRAAPYWNIHRHRQPAKSAALLQGLEKTGRLKRRKGAVRWHAAGGDLQARLEDGTDIRGIARVFNCRGPDYSLRGDPLLRALLHKNLLQRHENGLGVRTDKNLSAIGLAGGRLHVAGSLNTGLFLDSTSVPELRGQCMKISESLISAF